MSVESIDDKLQHPRRSLGNRHRSQAKKYLKIVNGTESDSTNLGWAEQNARQSVLHDFTHPENWRVLLEVKAISGDGEGIRAVLDDIFTVLGRDPELLNQLDNVDMLESGSVILEGAFAADPLDPDEWWNTISGSIRSNSSVKLFKSSKSGPPEEMSVPETSSPLSSKCLIKCRPTKPADPVTSAFIGSSCLHSSLISNLRGT